MIAGGSRQKISKGYSSYGKKSLPAAVGENFLGVIFHMEKNILLAAASEKFLRVIVHMVKKLLLAAAGEIVLGYSSYGKKDHC